MPRDLKPTLLYVRWPRVVEDLTHGRPRDGVSGPGDVINVGQTRIATWLARDRLLASIIASGVRVLSFSCYIGNPLATQRTEGFLRPARPGSAQANSRPLLQMRPSNPSSARHRLPYKSRQLFRRPARSWSCGGQLGGRRSGIVPPQRETTLSHLDGPAFPFRSRPTWCTRGAFSDASLISV
jgi:hypothetical protein